MQLLIHVDEQNVKGNCGNACVRAYMCMYGAWEVKIWNKLSTMVGENFQTFSRQKRKFSQKSRHFQTFPELAENVNIYPDFSRPYEPCDSFWQEHTEHAGKQTQK
jgi:hypothetical protein